MTNENINPGKWMNKNLDDDDYLVSSAFDKIPFFDPKDLLITLNEWDLEKKLRYNYETSLLLPENDKLLVNDRNRPPLSKRLVYTDKDNEKNLLIGFTVDGKQIYHKNKDGVLRLNDIPKVLLKEEKIIFDDIPMGKLEINNSFYNIEESFIYRAEIDIKKKLNNDFYEVNLIELNDKQVKDDQQKDVFYIRREDIGKDVLNNPIAISDTPDNIYNYIKKKNKSYVEASKESLEKYTKNKGKSGKKKKGHKINTLIPPIIDDTVKTVKDKISENILSNLGKPIDMYVKNDDFEKIKKIETISEIFLAHLFVNPFSDNTVNSLDLNLDDFGKLYIIESELSENRIIIDKHVQNLSTDDNILVLVYNTTDKKKEFLKISVNEINATNTVQSYDMSDLILKTLKITDKKEDIPKIVYETLHYISNFDYDFIEEKIKMKIFMAFELKNEIFLNVPTEILFLFSTLQVDTLQDDNFKYLHYLARINDTFKIILDYNFQNIPIAYFWYNSKLYNLWYDEKPFLDVDILAKRIPEIIKILKDKHFAPEDTHIKKLEDEVKNFQQKLDFLNRKISTVKSLPRPSAGSLSSIFSFLEEEGDENDYNYLMERKEQNIKYGKEVQNKIENPSIREPGETYEKLKKLSYYLWEMLEKDRKKIKQFWENYNKGLI